MHDYQNPALPVERRVEDLMSRMSMEEKLAQCCQQTAWTAFERTADGFMVTEQFQEILSGNGIGSLYGVLRADPWTGVRLETGVNAREGAQVTNMIQKYAIEHSRLGIPVLLGEECAHGHQGIGATVFPVSLTTSATWNPALVRRIGQAIARETRAQGGMQTFSPVVDVVRDTRWGRTEETYGEDPYLASKMAVAMVQGLQGENPEDLKSDEHIVATVKHFAGYGAPTAGLNGAAAQLGPREVREIGFPPFKAAIEQAGALSVMASYNEIDGEPVSGSRFYLTDVLRGEWGFKGFVISDMGSIGLLHRGHRVSPTLTDAAIKALHAGMDMEMAHGPGLYGDPLRKAWQEGRVPEDDINSSCARILTVKFLLGLFENPYVDEENAERVLSCPAHHDLALQAAREGIVLMKNEQSLLPLSRDIRSIAVIGPNSDNIYNQLGDYTAPQHWQEVVSALDGVKAKIPNAVIRYAKGCGVKNPDKSGFVEAIEAARASEVVLLVMGGSSARDFGEDIKGSETGAAVVGEDSKLSDMDCGEGFDRVSLKLSGVQEDLIHEIIALGKPTILVLINGRPVDLTNFIDHVPAVLEAWYPGQEGGHAIAEVLFGDYNPAGRLTLSFPRHVGQLPLYYNTKNDRRRYVDELNTPLFPFGFGLSYTSFAYSNLSVTPEDMPANASALISVDVTNTGSRDGDEVVQLYIRDDFSSLTRPLKELKGFERVFIPSGQTRRVSFTLTADELSFLDHKGSSILEPGTFTVMVGGNCADTLEAKLNIR